MIGGFKELGLYVIKHTDGNLWPIIDEIVDSGIDCLDPIDPQAGMDLGEVKAKYGHRVALKGNVDCAQTMTFGTPEDVSPRPKLRCARARRAGATSYRPATASIPPSSRKTIWPCWTRCNEYGAYPFACLRTLADPTHGTEGPACKSCRPDIWPTSGGARWTTLWASIWVPRR